MGRVASRGKQGEITGAKGCFGANLRERRVRLGLARRALKRTEAARKAAETRRKRAEES